MTRVAELVFALDLESTGAVSFAAGLEVSLACSHCRRTARTVAFTVGEATASCSPGSARTARPHPPYPGRIVELSVERAADGLGATATYRLEYELTPFVDARHGAARPWVGHPTWGRAHWSVVCSACGAVSSQSSQSNLVRPHTVRCACGRVLLVERRELPIIRYLEPGTDAWKRVPPRFGAP